VNAPGSSAPCPHTDFTIATETFNGMDSAAASCICGLRGKAFTYERGYTLGQVQAEESALLWWETNVIDRKPTPQPGDAGPVDLYPAPDRANLAHALAEFYYLHAYDQNRGVGLTASHDFLDNALPGKWLAKLTLRASTPYTPGEQK